MKHSLNRINKVLSIFMLFATLSVLTTSLPSAFADPDPGQGAFPNQIPTTGTTILKVGTGTHQAFTSVAGVAVYTDETVLTCPLPAAAGLEKRFDLRNAAGTPVTATLGTTTSSFEVPWGTGLTFGATTFGTVTFSSAGPYHWGEAATPLLATDSTATVDTLVFRTCGTEGATQAGAQPYAGDAIFSVVLPVGGELLSIDMTSVLVAGAFTNQMLLLPILGVVAATAFAILKIQVRKN